MKPDPKRVRPSVPAPSLSERDLKLLLTFRAVAEAGGFTAAERRLGVERSTISRQIQTLEERLGGRLCVRGPRGFELTEFGAAALAAAATVSDMMDIVRSHLSTAHHAITGELKLGVADNCMTNPEAQISAGLAAFAQRAPEVELHLMIDSPARLIEALKNRRLHAMIAGAPLDEPKLGGVRLFSEEFRLYACPPVGRPPPRLEELDAQGYGIVVRDAERTPAAAKALKLNVRRRVHAAGIEASPCWSRPDAMSACCPRI